MPQRPGTRKAPRVALTVAVYVALFALLILLAVTSRAPEEEVVYGSLEGRFDSAITLQAGDTTCHYREMEITNYLLIGVDTDVLTSGSAQADFLVLLSVDRRAGTITPLMVDRDTIAPVTTYGAFGNASGEKQMQICLAQAFHGKQMTGSDNTSQALSRVLCGVPIDHYVAVDMAGITLLNDAIGGVEVHLEDDFSALDPAMVQGATILLKGRQAELFVRSRMDVADGTNASRMQRQRLYLESLLPRLFEGSAWEDALRALQGHYETDMTDAAMLSDLQKYGDYRWQSWITLPGAYHIGEDGFTEFHPDEDAKQSMLCALWFH